ncbi:hypothetical protein AYI69_g6946 [Smittium culicis]|uniref:Uncharacterized protein n=1 Tax=Smittium culicis TaxID=133412 RepID=A0A1R1XVC3_9FUNG|nr:hypothetical protein AYI69_g6946 [Smittium culicis]
MSLARRKTERDNNQQHLFVSLRVSILQVYPHSLSLATIGAILISGLTKDLISVSMIALKNSIMYGEFSMILGSATRLNIADL